MQSLFPNQYILLVGGPGIGKGLVVKQVIKMLKFHKLVTAQHEVKAEDISDMMMSDVHSKEKAEDALLIPVAPETVTFEALIKEMATTMTGGRYKVLQPDGKLVEKTYTHKSLAFCLEEVSSLFQKNTEKVVNFLLAAFDCGDYDYVTKNCGTDRLRKICLNIFGGTTPSFMATAFNDRLIGEGFSSRTIFVYEFANRFNRFQIPSFTPEQLTARKEILAHIHSLSKLYGQVSFTADAFERMRYYFEEVMPNSRTNYNMKLDPYYARKNIHVQKMAMAVHFAERTSMTIGDEAVARAFDILSGLEKKMHNALAFGRNPLANISEKVFQYIKMSGPQTKPKLWEAFSQDLRETEIQECLNFLLGTKKIFITQNQETKEDQYERL